MLAMLPILLTAASPQALALANTPAIPQPTASTEDAAPAPQVDPQAAPRADGDIVITARRREERLQNVPIAVSVLSGDTISNTGAFNVNRLQTLQPSLQFYSSNPRNSAINIRGLGAPFGLTNDGIEQGVGLYIDQVYIGRVGASTFDFVDVERVEVLRGPQGTLYGKNTTAGAVNITTKKPSFEPEATFEVSTGNYGLVQLKASASAPIAADTLAVRISTSVTKRGGTVYDVRKDQNLQKQDNFSIRGQLFWQATPNLDFNFSGDFSLQNPYCCVQYYARVGRTQRPLNRQYDALAAALGYTPPSKDTFDRVTDLDAAINSRQEVGGLSLVGNWDVGPVTITSVTAWRYWDWLPANDRDFTGLPITTISQNPSQQKQFSQELRLASNGANKLDYTLGAFYFHQTINTQGSQVQGSAASRWLLNPGNVPVGATGCATATTAACNPLVLNGLTSTNTINFDNTSFAVFGKLNWKVTDKLHFQPGLRVNYDKKSGFYESIVSIQNARYNFVATADNAAALLASGAATADQFNTLAPQRYSPKFSAWNVSGDATLSYDFTSDVHAYATYARSFKSGGINLSGLPLNSTNTAVDLTTQTVKPEKVNHFEVGLKTQFFDRKVTINLAGFWDEIKDYQATVNNNAINVIRGYLANAGKVRVRGVEWDSSFRPSSRLSLYFNGAYTDAKYVDFKNAPCPPELSGGTATAPGGVTDPAGTPGGRSPAFCDISGQILPGISKWALSWGGEFNVPVTNGKAYIGYDGSYRSRFSSNPSRSAYTDIEGYSLSNVRVGFRTDKWNLYGWVRNVFDKQYYELLSTQSGSTGLIVGQPGDPRTYGGTFRISF